MRKRDRLESSSELRCFPLTSQRERTEVLVNVMTGISIRGWGGAGRDGASGGAIQQWLPQHGDRQAGGEVTVAKRPADREADTNQPQFPPCSNRDAEFRGTFYMGAQSGWSPVSHQPAGHVCNVLRPNTPPPPPSPPSTPSLLPNSAHSFPPPTPLSSLRQRY